MLTQAHRRRSDRRQPDPSRNVRVRATGTIPRLRYSRAGIGYPASPRGHTSAVRAPIRASSRISWAHAARASPRVACEGAVPTGSISPLRLRSSNQPSAVAASLPSGASTTRSSSRR